MNSLDYTVKLDVLQKGYDKKYCWVHCRAGAIPKGDNATVVMTAQPLNIKGCDVFKELKMNFTQDMGKSWSGFLEQPGFLSGQTENGVVICVCDFTPAWHEKTGKLLGTGHTTYYSDNRIIDGFRPRETAYSVYDEDKKIWGNWKTVKMPDPDGYFFNSGAGCTQRVDLTDGSILLPFYFKGEHSLFSSSVMKCSFDGENLEYITHGSELTIDAGRGLYEPSLAKYKENYYMTMRADEKGYLSASKDGMYFEKPVPWTWDDGTLLPTYNTQQHWVTHSEGLFLVYTRIAGDNGHVFRHRAPLFMARMDTEKLCLIRDSEKIIVPQRGARLGNFGTVNVSPHETWVTVSEWMQPEGCEKYGSDNSVYAARITWNCENLCVRTVNI